VQIVPPFLFLQQAGSFSWGLAFFVLAGTILTEGAPVFAGFEEPALS
jgi:hypothetical protein